MPHRKLNKAARAAGFAMVNQDSFENQSQFFVRLDKEDNEASPTESTGKSAERSSMTRTWLNSLSLRGSTA